MWALVLIVLSLIIGVIPLLLGAGPLVIIPLVLLVIAAGAGTRFGVRQVLRRQQQITKIRRFREQAQARKVELTEADRATTIPDR